MLIQRVDDLAMANARCLGLLYDGEKFAKARGLSFFAT